MPIRQTLALAQIGAHVARKGRQAPFDRSNDFSPLDDLPRGAQHAIWLNRARLWRWRALLDARLSPPACGQRRVAERLERQKLYAAYCVQKAAEIRTGA